MKVNLFDLHLRVKCYRDSRKKLENKDLLCRGCVEILQRI